MSGPRIKDGNVKEEDLLGPATGADQRKHRLSR